MSESKPLSDQERLDLVAYLDGELKGEAARSVQVTLNHNAAARAEADALKRTWELLDHLPMPEPSPDFTHRTVDRVAPIRTAGPKRADTLSAPQSSMGASESAASWRGWPTVGWIGAAVLAVGLGFFGTRAVGPHEPNEQDLVRDLRVIENKRLYEAAEDLPFLRLLDHPDLFGDDGTGT
jgi:anti-sigma factor RsiW